MKRKIYVVGGSYNYANWMQGKLTNVMEEADLVVFTGGEDINPALYGEDPHRSTRWNPHRDEMEVRAYRKARSLGKHMWGTCRGLQLFSALNGAKLIQHQSHPSYHPIILEGGKVVEITSCHHQACYPFDLPDEDYRILGWAENLSPFHLNAEGEEMNPPKEIEVLLYPHTKCLGAQGHLEWMNIREDSETFDYFHPLLTDFLNNKL